MMEYPEEAPERTARSTIRGGILPDKPPPTQGNADVLGLKHGDVVRIGDAVFIFKEPIFDGDELGRRGFVEIKVGRTLA